MSAKQDLDDYIDFGPLEDYERLSMDAPKKVPDGRLELEACTLQALSREAFGLIAFLLPKKQLRGFAAILEDPRASEADRFAAASLIRNAAIAAEGVLPLCQDTGSALVYGWKGSLLSTRGEADLAAMARGASAAYAEKLLRKSQLFPLDIVREKNSGDNLPIFADIRAVQGDEYRLCFSAKGGGSANKTSLFMEPPSLLDEAALEKKLSERISALGTAGCPPYRISFVLGGTAPEQSLRALSLAGLGLLDSLPETPQFRDSSAEMFSAVPLRLPSWEKKIEALAAASGLGAQFGGSRLAIDARVIRLPRHAASLAFALGVSCAAHRAVRARINAEGVWLERLERDPARFLPRDLPLLPEAREIDLDRPQAELAAALRALSEKSFVLVSGTVILARDAAHARFARALADGRGLPEYLSRYPLFYAGPTEAAPGQVSGSFGPTTAGRMDEYLDMLTMRGASLVSIAKGGRSPAAEKLIRERGGVYLATLGGAAALAAREHVVSSSIIDYQDLGMEAVRRVVLRRLPAMIAIGGAADRRSN